MSVPNSDQSHDNILRD